MEGKGDSFAGRLLQEARQLRHRYKTKKEILDRVELSIISREANNTSEPVPDEPEIPDSEIQEKAHQIIERVYDVCRTRQMDELIRLTHAPSVSISRHENTHHHRSDRRININPDEFATLHRALRKFVPSLSVEDTLTLCTLHELAHHFQADAEEARKGQVFFSLSTRKPSPRWLEASAEYMHGLFLKMIQPGASPEHIKKIGHCLFLLGTKKSVYLDPKSPFGKLVARTLSENDRALPYPHQGKRRDLFLRGFNAAQPLDALAEVLRADQSRLFKAPQ